MKTKMSIALAAAVIVAASGAATVAPISAHHSHAMFDGSKETEITGTLTMVRFANPHVYLRIEATHRDGVPLESHQTWAIEMSTVQNMTNRGITPNVLPIGAPISVKVNPLFSGGFSGNYTTVVMINGVKNASTGPEWTPAGS
ncbi:MAG: hypothetical protein HY657_11705 [Acidobacteria bacterium]|nr:hypothetical protein [Acidobacteriota bacterium]